MSRVSCDNIDCMFIDEYCFCDCDKLNIVGGVCTGSRHSGRNVCDGDADEALKAENAKLRKENDRLIQAIEDLHDVSLEDRLVQLENENDRLRDELEDLYALLAVSMPSSVIRDAMMARIRKRFRELGIEVS